MRLDGGHEADERQGGQLNEAQQHAEAAAPEEEP